MQPSVDSEPETRTLMITDTPHPTASHCRGWIGSVFGAAGNGGERDLKQPVAGYSFACLSGASRGHAVDT
ncbi:hypothetical protein Vqi01_43980 [Micromonospora qiuiae]|uniref:Uncharacterized protein n=1 Tax=Micromonospora qiuiae TaxID=502268 RepID=A0ABQ4JFR9_9ACTN|nr:hypothetical protein Vqi01_43980 [Micromonospora qiuiae]